MAWCLCTGRCLRGEGCEPQPWAHPWPNLWESKPAYSTYVCACGTTIHTDAKTLVAAIEEHNRVCPGSAMGDVSSPPNTSEGTG